MNSLNNDEHQEAAHSPALTLLYDGGCPLCLREVKLLGSKDRQRNGELLKLTFVDIDHADYSPMSYAGISYREAMGRIHAIDESGTVLRDVVVFRRAYGLIGLGWVYAPTQWPLLGPVINLAYGIWAGLRLRLTGRPSLESLCHARSGACLT